MAVQWTKSPWRRAIMFQDINLECKFTFRIYVLKRNFEIKKIGFGFTLKHIIPKHQQKLFEINFDYLIESIMGINENVGV